jgi:CubicO group peptidase (beta-lactamase class C family)
VLGAVYERATGRSVFAGFRDDIARPLGMLHYTGTFTRIDGNDPEARIPDTDGVYQYERDKSMYPAYHFRMSAHDLALYGELWRRRGRWNGRQVIPESWIDAATTAYSVTNEQAGIGYGMLWYVLMPNEERTTTSFYHTGAGVHMLGVYPGLRLVFVHRVDTERGTEFTPDRLYGVIGRVFSSFAPEREPPPASQGAARQRETEPRGVSFNSRP